MALDFEEAPPAESLGDLFSDDTKILYEDEKPEHVIGMSLGLSLVDGNLGLKVNASRIPRNDNGSACSQPCKAFSEAEARVHVQSTVTGLNAAGALQEDDVRSIASLLRGNGTDLLSAMKLDAEAMASLRNLMDVDICKPTLLIVTTPIVGLEFDDEPVTAKPGGRLDPNCSRPRLWDLGKERRRVFGWYSSYRHVAGQPVQREEHNFNLTLKVPGADGGSLPIIIDPGNNNGGTGRP